MSALSSDSESSFMVYLVGLILLVFIGVGASHPDG